MALKTLDVDALGRQYGNIYEAIVVASRRSRQVAAQIKGELSDRLSYYDGFDRDPEDRRMNDDQVRISLEYERMPKPTETALDELVTHKLHVRFTEADGNE